MSDTFTSQADTTLEEVRAIMRAKLKRLLPEFEIDLKAELAHRIIQLKAEKNAVILGHNYMDECRDIRTPSRKC